MTKDELYWEAARINQTVAKFIWIDGDELRVDLPVYAAVRGITVDEAEREIDSIISELIPGVEIVHKDEAAPRPPAEDVT
jgi:hypothetical protein